MVLESATKLFSKKKYTSRLLRSKRHIFTITRDNIVILILLYNIKNLVYLYFMEDDFSILNSHGGTI